MMECKQDVLWNKTNLRTVSDSQCLKKTSLQFSLQLDSFKERRGNFKKQNNAYEGVKRGFVIYENPQGTLIFKNLQWYISSHGL